MENMGHGLRSGGAYAPEGAWRSRLGVAVGPSYHKHKAHGTRRKAQPIIQQAAS
jgi:hypothetical protein